MLTVSSNTGTGRAGVTRGHKQLVTPVSGQRSPTSAGKLFSKSARKKFPLLRTGLIRFLPISGWMMLSSAMITSGLLPAWTADAIVSYNSGGWT